jgi:hypothetical protein
MSSQEEFCRRLRLRLGMGKEAIGLAMACKPARSVVAGTGVAHSRTMRHSVVPCSQRRSMGCTVLEGSTLARRGTGKEGTGEREYSRVQPCSGAICPRAFVARLSV